MLKVYYRQSCSNVSVLQYDCTTVHFKDQALKVLIKCYYTGKKQNRNGQSFTVKEFMLKSKTILCENNRGGLVVLSRLLDGCCDAENEKKKGMQLSFGQTGKQ